jgi:hypothetical protein
MIHQQNQVIVGVDDDGVVVQRACVQGRSSCRVTGYRSGRQPFGTGRDCVELLCVGLDPKGPIKYYLVDSRVIALFRIDSGIGPEWMV